MPTPRSALVSLFVLAATVASAQPADNIGHERHHHRHNDPHATDAPTPARFVTSRKSDVVLPLPQEKDAFTFVVFGDRTGGPAGGVSVLADAVRDTNLLEPDFVITVGDLIQGYNATPQWMEQMREFKGIMNNLICPWFPVSGNHDIYWRGEGKPDGEHEKNYEMHFGPLWYAFEHKNCWFIVLHSDESNPETGEKNFNKPESQRMSEEQFTWLKETLARAKDAEHVFLFLHHPRWLGRNYGDDWNKVHAELIAAGNVTAVFAGHIHRMRYDPKDGIEYVTLATVGGGQNQTVPDAGWLHQFHIVTVRKEQVAMAAIPVGEVMDVREISGQMADECAALAGQKPALEVIPALEIDGSASVSTSTTIRNTSSRPIDVTVMLDSGDSRWFVTPDHDHARIEPGASQRFDMHIERPSESLDLAFRPLEISVQAEYLMPGRRYAIPEIRQTIPLNLDRIPLPPVPAQEQAMHFDGDDALLIPDAAFDLKDGPFTLEAWLNAESFGDRVGLVCKTESSDYGIFVNRGVPTFSVFLGDRYAEARSSLPALKPGTWHHVAGVFDGKQVRIYIDGRLAGSIDRAGKRKTNKLPLIIGADVSGSGAPTSHFKGLIDAVGLTAGAKYTGEAFTPARRAAASESSILVYNMDGQLGPFLLSEASGRAIAERSGDPALAPAQN